MRTLGGRRPMQPNQPDPAGLRFGTGFQLGNMGLATETYAAVHKPNLPNLIWAAAATSPRAANAPGSQPSREPPALHAAGPWPRASNRAPRVGKPPRQYPCIQRPAVPRHGTGARCAQLWRRTDFCRDAHGRERFPGAEVRQARQRCSSTTERRAIPES